MKQPDKAKGKEGAESRPGFKSEITSRPGGENLKRCFACGTCTLSCPVAEVESDYSPRRIIHMILLGLKDEILSSDQIWYCQTCYRCHVRCPQNVKFPELMRVLREISYEEGYMEPEMMEELRGMEQSIQTIRKEKLKEILQKRNTKKG